MDVAETVEKRLSVRAFKPDPVPAETLRAILQAAQRAPSGGNLQPWKVYALAGEPLAALKRAGAEAAMARTETPQYDIYPPNLWEPLRTRRFECGEDLYGVLGIPREDKAARLRWFGRNLEFFGAPVGLFFTLDRRAGPPQWSDCGMFMQTIMLLAVERGLATCAQEFWATLPKTVQAATGHPDEEMLFSGMALGWPDEADPVNTLRTRRAALEEVVTFIGF
jgi:nitroreductase